MELKEKREQLKKQSNYLKYAIEKTSYQDKYEENIDLRVKKMEVDNRLEFIQKFMETQKKLEVSK